MGIRASSGGQLGGGGNGSGNGNGGVLTVEQVQDIVSDSLVTDNLINGLSLVSTYDDATGKIKLSLATPNAPITNVIPASIDVKRSGVVIGAAVLVSAFVSLTLTPMLNAYLMKGGEQKKSKFYIATEPFFQK